MYMAPLRGMYCWSRSWALAPILMYLFTPFACSLPALTGYDTRIRVSQQRYRLAAGGLTPRHQYHWLSALTSPTAMQQLSNWPKLPRNKHSQPSANHNRGAEVYRGRQQKQLQWVNSGANPLMQPALQVAEQPQAHHQVQPMATPSEKSTSANALPRRLLALAAFRERKQSVSMMKSMGHKMQLLSILDRLYNANDTMNYSTGTSGNALSSNVRTEARTSTGYTASNSSASDDGAATGLATTRDASSSRDLTVGGDVPSSCSTSKYKYAQFQIDMTWDDMEQDYGGVEDKVSHAIAQQLQLEDDYGQLDPSRVETYVASVYHEAEGPDHISLDVFVYLSGSNCEVFKDSWMQSVQDDPASLFQYDADLQAAVVNVTAVFMDPGQDEKQSVLSSSNMVISVSIGNQVDNNTDSNSGSAVYNWFFTSGAVSRGSLDGMLIMGITTGSLLVVLIATILMRRWVQGWYRRRVERAFTAAALAATAAATQQAGLGHQQGTGRVAAIPVQ